MGQNLANRGTYGLDIPGLLGFGALQSSVWITAFAVCLLGASGVGVVCHVNVTWGVPS